MKTCETLISEIKERLAKPNPFDHGSWGEEIWESGRKDLRTDLETLTAMVERAKKARCLCGQYEWLESDCPTCIMNAELDRLAGSGNIPEPPLIKETK